MKLINDTKYPSVQLRTVICRVHKSLRRTQGKLRTWGRVEIRIRRRLNSNHTSGHAFLTGTYAVLTIPAPHCETRTLYRLMWHEMQHLYGHSHKNMGVYYPPEDEVLKYCEGLPQSLVEIQEIPKPKSKVQMERYETVLVSLARWQSKLRRAQTAVRKLKTKQRYYEHTLMAAGKLAKGE